MMEGHFGAQDRIAVAFRHVQPTIAGAAIRNIGQMGSFARVHAIDRQAHPVDKPYHSKERRGNRDIAFHIGGKAIGSKAGKLCKQPGSAY